MSALSQGTPQCNVIFIAQKGELGLKAAFLAWSLRVTHGSSLGLFAAVPSFEEWGEPEPEVFRSFEQLGVKVVRFEPPFAPEYPIGNKTRVLGLLPPGLPAVFLDSDMASLSAWNPLEVLGSADLAMKPADVATWGQGDQWRQVFDLLGRSGNQRYTRATVSGELMPAYYNAGLVACRDPATLAKEWEAITAELHVNGESLPNRYPWLDQIALAVLVRSSKLDVKSLGEYWNYPAHLKALPVKRMAPGICHYHRPEVILREPALLWRFRKACSELPELARLASRYESWKRLFKPRLPWRKTDLSGCDFIITGVPRSGTSLVCRLLDEQRNWLVVNEPAEVFRALEDRRDASGVGEVHRGIREKILTGQPIENKVNGAEVISDTAHLDERHLYYPEVSGRFFRLGTKNTLAYLAALDPICELGWPVVAMIRHPMDTLASWRNTFAHLRTADVSGLPVANPEFHGWSGWQRQAMLEITRQDDDALRRVLLWRLLARTLLLQKGRILLWRYEDLVADPAGHIRQLRRRLYGKGWRSRVSFTLERTDNTSRYCEEERWLLRELCGPELQELGYEL